MSAALTAHLIAECSAIQDFIELMDHEAEALVNGDFAALPDLTKRKEELADQIVALDREREQHQKALGWPTDRKGADAAAAAGDKKLQNAWQALMECAAQAQERNHRNGVLVHTHLDYTREAINFLRSNGRPLYGPDGKHMGGVGNGTSLATG
jgi:flagellar biosynthesis protein FlgN